MKKAVKELAHSASRALGVLKSKFFAAGGMDFKVFTKLYDSLVQPILLYGSGIWGINNHREINVIQNKACRLFLGVGPHTSNVATRGEMGWMSCHFKQLLEVSRLWCRLNGHRNRLCNQLFKWSYSLSKKRIKTWEMHVTNFFVKYELHSDTGNDVLYTNIFIQQVKSKLLEADQLNWYNELWNDHGLCNGNKLRLFRLYKNRLNCESYVKDFLPLSYRQTLAKLRCGNLPLAVETGRYTKPPIELNQRLCIYCKQNVIENEMHFLIDCDLYSDVREDLFERMRYLDDSFDSQSSLSKMCNIMCMDNIQTCLAKTCYFMYKTRKQNTM